MERDDDGERGSTVLSFSINGGVKRPVFSGILTSILGMEILDSRALRSSANPLSLCTEEGGPRSGWDALRAPEALKVDARRASDPGHPKPEWR
jgi:hypothetical protein